MSSNRRVRWGILGTGKIAHDFTQALLYLPDVEVVAVGSRNKQSAESFAKQFQIPKSYGSYEELSQDPDVEVVYVSSVHPLHMSNSIMCLKNGKHVLSEKPLTMNAKQAEEAIKIARENNKFYMEAMWTRFFPAVEKVRQLIKEGQLGDIKLVFADFGFKHAGNIARLVEDELGGGAILDIGVYPISLASMAYGGTFPSKISTTGSLGASGLDTQAAITLEFKPEEVANLACTLFAETPREATIIGTKGSVRFHFPFWCPTKLTVTLEGKPPQDLEFPLVPSKQGQTWNFTNSMGLHYEAAHVNEMIRQGKTESDVISLGESLSIMKIMDEVRRQIGVVYQFEKK